MQIRAFRAIRFNSDYWNLRPRFKVDNSSDKIQQTQNILMYLNSQIANGSAKIDAVPGLYILRTTSSQKRMLSIIGEIDYNEKSVLFTNEEIYSQKLECYKSMFQKFKIQTSPVLTFYKNHISIEATVADILNTIPTISANIGGILYELWRVSNARDISRIKQMLGSIDRLYIADGHHRFSLFTNVISKTSAKLIISVTDANSILLKSCHRVVCGAISMNWREKILQLGDLEKINSFDNVAGKVVLVFPTGENFAVDFRDKYANKNIFDIVKKDVIEFCFGVRDYDDNVFPLPGNVSPAEANAIFRLYKNASMAIFVPSINISDFLDIIDNGHKLPATSTWFEPKIVDGFILRKFS